MPANAARQPEGNPALAAVVPLDKQRSLRKALAAPAAAVGEDQILADAARRYWTSVFTAAGLDLSAPHVADVTTVLTTNLDRLITGFVSVRRGAGDRAPNPEAGLDETSALEMRGALRDLASAVESARTERG
ncbi:hypothetical protein ACUXZZ_45140 (plasmid) [Streptomyces graminifolii]|uniref:hypothetical protein n=1 Tax=Streptomyces graminifolii TaxID=1266771 RepID=UPI0040582781